MEDYPAHGLVRQPFRVAIADLAQRLSAPPEDPTASLKAALTSMLDGTPVEGATPAHDPFHSFRWILRQPLPGPTYPKYLRKYDKTTFDNYSYYIDELSPPAVQKPALDADKSSSPTLLSVSQKIYDAEVTRRDSINGRCTAVLSTAGILGALVVGAGQIGLTLHNRSLSGVTVPVLIFFLVSLAYLSYSITIALQVHGAIQGEVIDNYDLFTGDPGTPLDTYNFNIAKTCILYANFNWCLNNGFKYRLQSAQRALRNGVIAVVIAGAVSPWAVSSSATASSAPSPGVSLISSHATASIQRTSLAPPVKE